MMCAYISIIIIVIAITIMIIIINTTFFITFHIVIIILLLLSLAIITFVINCYQKNSIIVNCEIKIIIGQEVNQSY